MFAVERRGTQWDTRFAPARRASGPGSAIVYVLLEGWLAFHEPAPLSLVAPAAFAATEAHLEGEGGRRALTLRSGGEPFRALELRLRPDRVRTPLGGGARAIALPADAIAACEEVLAAFDEGRDPVEAVDRALAALAAAEIVDPGARDEIVREEPPRLARTWAAVRGMYMRLATAPSLQELADHAGVSLRQLARDIDELGATFPLGADGFRELTGDIRLRWAVLLLSSPALRIADVARSAGYGSSIALGRAFREAGLPSPSAVRSAFGAALSDPKLS